MKKIIISFLAVLVLYPLWPVHKVLAQSCWSNLLVKEWIKERNRMELSILRKWIKGAGTDELASDIARLLYVEFKIATTCRKNPKFLQKHLHLLNSQGVQPDVESVPGILLEKVIGRPVLSPRIETNDSQSSY